MHELSIIVEILKTVERVMIDENLTAVEAIVLEAGELSGVVPSLIEECFPAAVQNTRFENTRLELEIVPGTARCLACGAEFGALEKGFTCPECNGKELAPLGGREFLIKEIHAY